MSTAEVARLAESNAQAAQDVQNMLAELKGSEKPGAAPAAIKQNDAEKAGEKQDTAEADTTVSNGKNGVEKPEIEKEDRREEKKEEGAEESAEHTRGHRAFRGGGRGRGGDRNRGDFKSYRQNIKSDLTNLEETDDPVQIRRQVMLRLVPSSKG